MIYTLKENEIFCCENGCGSCGMHEMWETYSEEVSPCGTERTTKDHLVMMSACCWRQGYGVFVWNTEKDEEVDINE